jgi:hypothetical protein
MTELIQPHQTEVERVTPCAPLVARSYLGAHLPQRCASTAGVQFCDLRTGNLRSSSVRSAMFIPVGRIEPDRVLAALAKEDASLPAQVALQVAELHASTNSSGSRRAFGGRSFSARSRWHSSTSLSASSSFALASPRVSPCEIAAGTSYTKHVYPPALGGCHTAPPLASRRENRFAHAEHGLLITRLLITVLSSEAAL